MIETCARNEETKKERKKEKKETLDRCYTCDFVARLCRATLTRVKVAENTAELYSENESRDCATRRDATCDTPCHTCDFDHTRLCRRCDIGLTVANWVFAQTTHVVE